MTFGEIGYFLNHHIIWEQVSNDHSIYMVDLGGGGGEGMVLNHMAPHYYN